MAVQRNRLLRCDTEKMTLQNKKSLDSRWCSSFVMYHSTLLRLFCHFGFLCHIIFWMLYVCLCSCLFYFQIPAANGLLDSWIGFTEFLNKDRKVPFLPVLKFYLLLSLLFLIFPSWFFFTNFDCCHSQHLSSNINKPYGFERMLSDRN